jgi:DNA-binding NtrC family response regulator
MMRSILVLTKDDAAYKTIRSCFAADCELFLAGSTEDAVSCLRQKRYDIAFIDLSFLQETVQGKDYRIALEPYRKLYPTIHMIVMSPQEKARDAVAVVRSGASDYLTYPIDPEEVRLVTDELISSEILESELDYLRDQFWAEESHTIIKTKSSSMKAVYENIRAVAPTKSTVLLLGETGVGKGVLANLIHQHSNRRDGPFISVHCGAIPDSLIESELFGHEKGAFTGAVRRKLGRFEIATGGTIFLDEVGTITPSVQIKLLQILQDGTYERVGGEANLQADVRVISASNRDLGEMCNTGEFRKDLYYRLNVFPIEIPPLRERLDDIPHLVEIFLSRLNSINNKEIKGVGERVIHALMQYSWPGNIRELENIVERAYILETASVLTPRGFPTEMFTDGGGMASMPLDTSLTLEKARRRAIEEIEKNYLMELLAKHRGKIKGASENAGITTRQLHKLMTKYGLRKEEFK